MDTIQQVAQSLLLAVKKEEDYQPFKQRLAVFPAHSLFEQLTNDTQKKAFWINTYNAYFQIVLKEIPSLAHKKAKLYSYPWFEIAGQRLSFDTIEHGILRKSQFKFGLGYVSMPSVSNFELKSRVQVRDARIHFALNCGATSCPPIAFYTPERLETQLEMATHSYLEQTTTYDVTKNQVKISPLLLWFRGDFGGKKGILTLLKKYTLISQNASPSLSYKSYDWSLHLANFS